MGSVPPRLYGLAYKCPMGVVPWFHVYLLCHGVLRSSSLSGPFVVVPFWSLLTVYGGVPSCVIERQRRRMGWVVIRLGGCTSQLIPATLILMRFPWDCWQGLLQWRSKSL
jgi:hypothetical protein